MENITIQMAGSGAAPVFVGVYDVERRYGGPEEGGWWYDTGTLIQVVVCASDEEATRVRDDIRGEFPNTGRRYSVLGGEDYDVVISEEMPVPFFPEHRPHYE